MSMELTQNERIVLIALYKSKKQNLTEKELFFASNLKIENTVQAAFMLADKGLIDIAEEVNYSYSLMKEGEEYAEKGLPERRVLDFINKRGTRASLEDIRNEFGKNLTGIAFGWLKKKGWADIDKGALTSRGKFKKGKDELILEQLSENRKIDETESNDDLKNLLKRNLISSTEKKERKMSITEPGQNKISTIEDTAVDYDATRLTSDMIRSGEWKNKRFRKYDINLPSQEIFPAKINPYRRILENIRKIFLEMGFSEIKGDIIQSSFWNFDALFQPQDHPARDMQDTFYLNTESEIPGDLAKKIKEMHEHGGKIDSAGWGGSWSETLSRKNVLRTHTTAITIKYLYDHPDPPVKVFCIDRVYRREAIDPTHTPEFEQLEGIVMDENVSFSNLLGLLSEFYKKMGFEVRFRPGYFPYTEPSVEAEIRMGDRWIELGGAGVFRQEVTEPIGVKYPVLAWGLGVGRLAMLKLGLTDLRDLYRADIDWLRRIPLHRSEVYE